MNAALARARADPMNVRRDDAEHCVQTAGSGPDEFTIQCAVVQHLMLYAAPDVVWFHCPNGEYRSKRTAGRLKAMGVRPGCPDLILICNGVSYGLELKAGKGRQTESQRAMESSWNAAGGRYAVARGLDEALSLLHSWEALRATKGGARPGKAA